MLDHVPAPIIVLDDQGDVVYANQAALEVTGWSEEAALGLNSLALVHPDDLRWAADVFSSTVGAGDDAAQRYARGGGVHFRIRRADGDYMPLQVTSADGLADPEVNGVILDARPDWGPQLMSEILAGLARGEPIDVLLQWVTELVALPPATVAVAIVDLSDARAPTTVAASDDGFAVLAPLVCPAPDAVPRFDAQVVALAELDTDAHAALAAVGVEVAWRAPVVVPDSPLRHWVVAAGEALPRYELTVLERTSRAADVASAVLARVENDARVLHAATHDALTGLLNRAAFYQHVAEVAPAGRGMALLYIDLDRFKPVNDRFGHATGDVVLCAIADRLRGCVRPADAVARLGGDEFAVCLADPVDDEVATTVVERIRAVTAEPIPVPGTEGHEVTVGASIGVAVSRPGTDAESLIAEADAAMYSAKRERRSVDHDRPV